MAKPLRLYIVRAALPGFDISSDYILLAENKKDAECRLLEAFPGSEIRSVSKQDKNYIFETRGLAYCTPIGRQTDKDYEVRRDAYAEKFQRI